ncbi:MAG: DEAD/DEAH box helicase [Steroidobacteraceae bacterium]|jgi:ATP-dependent RNA helicase RhlE|nr:DEAD/DEAH box helicase [Steroidobacteraceae bacterium]
MHFSDLGLEPELLRAVADKGYDTPTPIQQQAIPPVLAGRDLLAGAQTGTGKTAGFVLPLLQKLGSASGRAPRVLVLTPTRELAAQVAQSVKDYGTHKNLRARVIFGGVGEQPQIDGLRAGCDILIATPGRLLDLANRGLADLSQVAHFVLDEADRMLDMGFIHDIRRVMRLLPSKRQNLLFSATYNDEIRTLAAKLLNDPVHVEVTPRNSTAERVEQVAYRVDKDHKRHLLVHLFKNGIGDEGPWTQALVFTRTKHGANRLAQQLEGAGIRAAAIHGNKSQSARVKALADFKAGKITALVATEVASRGLDIKELPQVVNYELPNVPEDYVHRIGRTARAGAEGHAVSLVAPDEASLLRDIERTMRRPVPFAETPHFAILRQETAAPAQAQQRRDDRPAQAPRKPQAQQRQSNQKPAGRPAGTRSFGGRGSGRPGGFRAGRA